MNFRRWILISALGLAGVACGGTNSVTERPDIPGPPARDQTLRVAITDPESIDPTQASSRWGTFVIKQICDSLVGSDSQTATLRPAIAESWTISDDAKTITFKLRPGVKFHNGREVTAEDYVWSLSRFVSPANGSPQHFLFEKVVGYPEVRAGQATSLAGVKAPDPHLLEISLVEANAELPAVLANPSAGAAIPREAVAGAPEAFAAKPICTGPYLVESPWTKGQDLRLVRFNDYYGANKSYAGGGAGKFGKVVLKVAADEKAAAKLLDQAQADVAPVPLESLSGTRLVRNRVSAGPTGYFAYVGLPVTQAPFDQPGVRRALSASIDRRSIIKGLLAESRIPATGFLPPSAGLDGAAAGCSKSVGPTAEQGKAKQELAGSGPSPTGKTLPIYLNSDGGHEKWLQKVSDQWRKNIGISSELRPMEWKSYLDYLAGPGADGPFRLAWAVKYPSPEAIFQPLFETGSLDNFTKFSDPQFDGLLKKARSTVNDSERRQAYAAAAQTLCEQMPVIPMWFGQNQFAFAHGVRSAGPRPLQRVDVYGDPNLRDLMPG
ncbi:MAG: ABC transporter substrate-binding protein [Actinomycetota bacterium]